MKRASYGHILMVNSAVYFYSDREACDLAMASAMASGKDRILYYRVRMWTHANMRELRKVLKRRYPDPLSKEAAIADWNHNER